MTTWTPQTTSSSTWTIQIAQARGYIETEDNLFLLATEDGDFFQQEQLTDIDTEDWQELTPVSTSTWTIQ